MLFCLSLFTFAIVSVTWADEAQLCAYIKQIDKIETRYLKIQQDVEEARQLASQEVEKSIERVEKAIQEYAQLKGDLEKRMQPFIGGEISTLVDLQKEWLQLELDYTNLLLDSFKAKDVQSIEEQFSAFWAESDSLKSQIKKETERLLIQYPYPCGASLSSGVFITRILPGILVLLAIVWIAWFRKDK